MEARRLRAIELNRRLSQASVDTGRLTPTHAIPGTNACRSMPSRAGSIRPPPTPASLLAGTGLQQAVVRLMAV